MASVYKSEQRVRAAILENLVDAYKGQHPNLLDEPIVKRAILIDAFFRRQSVILLALVAIAGGAAVIALFQEAGTILLGAVGLIVFGLGAEITFLYISFQDEARQARVVANLLRDQVAFDLGAIQDKKLQARLYKALEYWSLIDETIAGMDQGPLRDYLLTTHRQMTHWLQMIYTLARQIDQFRLSLAVHRELQTLPIAIQQDEQRLRQAGDAEERRHLEQIMARRQEQLRILQTLQNQMKETRERLDSILSALGALHSQLLLLRSQREANGPFNRLQAEISEQVYQLKDLVEAAREVIIVNQSE